MKNMIIPSSNLITPYRFDLMIKYLYGKSILESYRTNVFKKFYYDHIEKWNGFVEPGNDSKQGFDAFDSTFRQLIREIGENGFDSSKGLIPVTSSLRGFSILNGAHRTVAAILHNKDVECQIGEPFVDGVFDASWITRFSKHGLDQEMTDLAAIQYAKLKPSTHIAVLFPSSRKCHQAMMNSLNYEFNGKIVYSKEVNISEQGSLNLMKEFYGNETWIGTEEDDYSGLRYKAGRCFPTKEKATVLLLDYENLDEVVKAKKAIRDIAGIRNHSVHISDTHEQSIELSKLFFNENSLTWLNHANFHKFTFFERLIKLFKYEIRSNNYDIDEYCITASSVLSAFGLRQGDDLDYIMVGGCEPLHSHGYSVNCHNAYGLKHSIYSEDYDEMIMNPKHHFYYKGVKFLSLENIMSLKLTRGEKKDIADVKLINELFGNIV